MAEKKAEHPLGAHFRKMYPLTGSSVTHTDDDGNPTGGYVQLVTNPYFPGGSKDIIEFGWQDGVIDDEKGPNGATIEALLEACVMRLRSFQKTKFSCRENSCAITKIEEAIHWLEHRRQDRMNREVLGTYIP